MGTTDCGLTPCKRNGPHTNEVWPCQSIRAPLLHLNIGRNSSRPRGIGKSVSTPTPGKPPAPSTRPSRRQQAGMPGPTRCSRKVRPTVPAVPEASFAGTAPRTGSTASGTLTYAATGCHDPRALRRTWRPSSGGSAVRIGEPFPYLWVPEWHAAGHGLHVHFAVGRYVRHRADRGGVGPRVRPHQAARRPAGRLGAARRGAARGPLPREVRRQGPRDRRGGRAPSVRGRPGLPAAARCRSRPATADEALDWASDVMGSDRPRIWRSSRASRTGAAAGGVGVIGVTGRRRRRSGRGSSGPARSRACRSRSATGPTLARVARCSARSEPPDGLDRVRGRTGCGRGRRAGRSPGRGRPPRRRAGGRVGRLGQ